MMRWVYGAAVPALLVLFAAAPASAADDLHTSCGLNKDKSRVKCDLRFVDPLARNSIDRVFLRWKGRDKDEEVDFTTYDRDGVVTAWLILVDKTKSMWQGKENPKTGKTVTAIRNDLKKIVGRMSRRRHALGLATFAADTEVLSRIDSSSSSLNDAIDKIVLDGERTALFDRARRAIDTLADFKGAERRALVILSDGKSEDPESDYFKTATIDEAKENGIVIHAVAYDDKMDAQSLRRMVDETQGSFFVADKSTREAPARFIDTFFDTMTTGGTIDAPARGNKDDSDKPEFRLTAEFDDGDEFKKTHVLDSRVEPEAEGLLAWWRDLEPKWKYIYAGGGAGGIALLALAAFFALGRRRSAHDDPFGDEIITRDDALTARSGLDPVTEPWDAGTIGLPQTAAAGVGAGAGAGLSPRSMFSAPTRLLYDTPAGGIEGYGWLERTDTGERLPITATSVRIGRHDDNDINIIDDSVHRRHAVMHMTPERDFIITDLNWPKGNKVKVNSKAAEKTKLKNGDLIQIGEVKLRFNAG